MASFEKIERARKILTKAFLILSIFGLLGTFISNAYKVDPGVIAPMVTVLIILSGATVVALGISEAVSTIFLMMVCGSSEVLGVLTGKPFGSYDYTDRWWPTISLGEHHLFPLLIPFAWLLILGGSYRILRSRVGKWSAVPLCALLTTCIDIPLERAMTDVFGYWKWTPAGPLFGAPISNTIGWFTVSIFGSSILAWRDQGKPIECESLILMSFCFFVAGCGAIAKPDSAWLTLMGIGLACVFISKRDPKI